jgi:quinol monooxygenase YgiN
MIHVIATIEVHEGKRDALLTELRRIVPLVRAEDGCIEYGPTVDAQAGLPVATPLRPNVLTILEKWASLDALRAHLGAPHMIEYRTRVKELVKGVSLQVLEPV